MPEFNIDNYKVSSSSKMDELVLLLDIAKHGYAICTYDDPKTFNFWNAHLKNRCTKQKIFIKEKKYGEREEDLIEYLENEKSSFSEKMKEGLQKFTTDYKTLSFSISGLEIKYEVDDIGRLNILRDFFLTFKHFIILWIPDNYLKEIALKTPDFWRIRTKVFQFDRSDRHVELGLKNFTDDVQNLANFDKAITKNDKNPQAWNNKGICLLRLGRFEDALCCFEKAIAISPHSVQFLNNYGVSLCLLKKHNKSVPFFKKGIEIDGRDPRILSNYGVALTRLQFFKDATLCFKKLLGLNPKNEDAMIHLSSIYLKTNRLQKATECLDPLRRAGSQNPLFLINLGIIETKLNHHDLAKEYFENSISSDPSNTEAYFHRGILFSKMNEPERALDNFDRALEIDAMHKDTLEKRKRILKKLKARA